ncbi:MAG: HAD family phosphatase [Saprospiraceae bacterium]
MISIDTIIFDLGAVLVDWNPRYVYKDVFITEDAMEHFLSEVCSSHWNELQDAGRSFAEGTQWLTNQFPQYTAEIKDYYVRWEDMLKGSILDTVNIFKELKGSGNYKIYALTNWSAESFPIAMDRFDFFHWFDGILVSGQENLKKPDPAIYELLFSRYGIDRSKAIFIDDNMANVVSAEQLGLRSIHFKNGDLLATELRNLGVLN